ncbi:MAG: hypothetical protein DRG33_02535 [Deltaproteobacteria bacterium]|nr:MAG: hypothetical protein DRG33_02535 [Deltaproteobacteria bacterium]
MARPKVICPFMGKPCKECAEYRGRHYYLCFWKGYREHVEGIKVEKKSEGWEEAVREVNLPEDLRCLTLEGFAEMERREG